jgi:6-phosphogluconolactonase (cycloisomerase 2 family)
MLLKGFSMPKTFSRAIQRCTFLFSLSFALSSFSAAQAQQPLTLLTKTPLPQISGDFDHFAFDLNRNRLVVAAEENHTLEVFELKSGKHLRTIPGFKAPHSIAYVSGKDEFFIADGEDASCIILSGSDFHRVDRIPLAPGADAALYDSQKGRLYIGNGGREEKKKTSTITIIAVADHKKIGEIPIDGDNIEAMAVDHAHHRLFVNIRDKKQIGVIDLSSNKTVSTWTAPGMNRNTTLRFDEVNQRVFVAGRTPGKFYVFNATDGSLVTAMDSVDMADDMTWDPESHRIYVTGSQGISIFKQQSKDAYTQLSRMTTIGGKTSIFVPQLKQFYVVHPKNDVEGASLLIYRANP